MDSAEKIGWFGDRAGGGTEQMRRDERPPSPPPPPSLPPPPHSPPPPPPPAAAAVAIRNQARERCADRSKGTKTRYDDDDEEEYPYLVSSVIDRKRGAGWGNPSNLSGRRRLCYQSQQQQQQRRKRKKKEEPEFARTRATKAVKLNSFSLSFSLSTWKFFIDVPLSLSLQMCARRRVSIFRLVYAGGAKTKVLSGERRRHAFVVRLVL
ncbi:hypothetical protein IWX48DRAFT_588291 [Phyllosticta citricarpa]